GVASRTAIALRRRGSGKPVVIKIRLADGRMYGHAGTLNFFDNTVAGNTDTITLRGDVGNPLSDAKTDGATRELVDGEFVTVILEDAEPIEAVTIPRAAVLTDQQGDYVYVVDGENKVQQRRIQLGPATPGIAAVLSGLREGEQVVVEGIQRIRPGELVSPGSAGTAEGTPGSPAPGLRRDSMLSAIFISRPRLAIVIAIVITLAGLIALTRIPLAQFPDIVPPRVQVTASYPGASAAVIEAAVAQPLEAQIVGVDKMIYMKSTSANDGTYNLTVSFAVGTNPDIDTVNVNNRVQTALPQLPQIVQLQGLTVIKRSAAILQFLNLYSDDGKLTPVFITSYATLNVLDELSRVTGVGQALMFGKLNYSMRIWFNTQRLTNLSLAPS